MNNSVKKIRTWWPNRAVTYVVPALFVYYAVANALDGDLRSATTNILLAICVLIFCEHLLFGYKIDLDEHYLTYRRGLFGAPQRMIARTQVKSVQFAPLIGTSDVRSKRLVVELEDASLHVLSLASFRPQDVKAIVDWMPSARSA